MIIDAVSVLVFLWSSWIGWTLRILVDWVRLLWLALFCGLMVVLIPFYKRFVSHSSMNIPGIYFYILGAGLAVLIFLSYYVLLKKSFRSATGVQRLVGSLVFGEVAFLSWMVILWGFSRYGWIDISKSYVFNVLHGLQ